MLKIDLDCFCDDLRKTIDAKGFVSREVLVREN